MTYERDPRGPRPVLNKRRRGALAPTLITLGVLIVLGLIASQMWTEVLWYQSVGFTQVYRTELITKVVLFVLGAVVMGAAVAASLMIGYRSRPIYAPVSTEQVGLDATARASSRCAGWSAWPCRSSWPCSPGRRPASSGRPRSSG